MCDYLEIIVVLIRGKIIFEENIFIIWFFFVKGSKKCFLLFYF